MVGFGRDPLRRPRPQGEMIARRPSLLLLLLMLCSSGRAGLAILGGALCSIITMITISASPVLGGHGISTECVWSTTERL
jgi:hypothetical protein